MKYLGDIDFVFDNSLLTFNLKDVIEKYALLHNNDVFVIDVCFIKSKYNNTWIFGEVFFRKYIMHLDFEKEEIMFCSNNMFITIDNSTVHKQLFLFISTCLFNYNSILVYTKIIIMIVNQYLYIAPFSLS